MKVSSFSIKALTAFVALLMTSAVLSDGWYGIITGLSVLSALGAGVVFIFALFSLMDD
jgi:hypothetical protein